jgi:hypothetical protein
VLTPNTRTRYLPHGVTIELDDAALANILANILTDFAQKLSLAELEVLKKDLQTKLAACSLRYGINAKEAFIALKDLPARFLLPRTDERIFSNWIDPDTSAKLLWFRKTPAKLLRARKDELTKVRWDGLTKAEKRAAKKSADMVVEDRLFARQRPNIIDYRIALYLAKQI